MLLQSILCFRRNESCFVKWPVDGSGDVAKVGVYAFEKTEIEGQRNSGSSGKRLVFFFNESAHMLVA